MQEIERVLKDPEIGPWWEVKPEKTGIEFFHRNLLSRYEIIEKLVLSRKKAAEFPE